MKTNTYANFDELVFNDRNKSYGAYVLRKEYENNVLIGLFSGLFLMTALFLFSYVQVSAATSPEASAPMPPDIYVINHLPKPDEPVKTQEPEKQSAPKQTTQVFKTLIMNDDVENITVNDELKKALPGIENQDGDDNNIGLMPGTGGTDNSEIEGEEEEKLEINDLWVIDEHPEYPGGEKAMYDFLGKNIRYPDRAKNIGITGTVYLSFVIDEFGGVRDVQIARGIGGGCDEEAARVVKSMKRWKPGKQAGRAVKVRYQLPIQFELR